MDCDYEDKYVLMYGALEQDLDELQAEAAEVATLLQQAKEKKLRLQAEIKFLKKRALMLRGSMRIPDPYLSREVGGEGGTHYIFGPSRVSAGRMMPGDFQAKTFNTTPLNMFYRPPAYSVQSSKHQQDVVGVLKTSSKQAANGVLQSKRVGKRKISWQDEFSGKA